MSALPHGWSAALFQWLATYLVHGTVLAGAYLLLRRLPAVRRSTRRLESLGRVALLGALVTATLQVLAGVGGELGHVRVEREAVARPPAAPDGVALHAGPPLPSADGAREWLVLERGAAEAPAVLVPLAAERRGEPAADAGRSPSPGSAGSLASGLPHWTLLLLGVWAALAAFSLGRLALGCCRFRRRLAGRVVHRGALADELERLRTRAGFRPRVRLSICERLRVPVTVGLVRPEVALPPRALAELTLDERRSILAHELAHAVRRDPVWFLLYELVERAFPFQPLVRLVHRDLRAAAELACDDLAVRWSGARLDLASSLTEIASWLVTSPRYALPVATMARERSRLAERVGRLLEERAAEPAPGRVRTAAALGALFSLGAVAPGIRASEVATVRPARVPVELPASAAAEPAGAPSPGPRTGPRSGPPPSAPSARPPAAGPARPALVDGAVLALQLDRELLDDEVERLGEEVAALRTSTALLRPDERAALERIEQRMEALSVRNQRVQELLAGLFGPAGLRVGDAPRADVPEETP